MRDSRPAGFENGVRPSMAWMDALPTAIHMPLNLLGERAGREQIDRLEVRETAVFKVTALKRCGRNAAISFTVASFAS